MSGIEASGGDRHQKCWVVGSHCDRLLHCKVGDVNNDSSYFADQILGKCDCYVCIVSFLQALITKYLIF